MEMTHPYRNALKQKRARLMSLVSGATEGISSEDDSKWLYFPLMDLDIASEKKHDLQNLRENMQPLKLERMGLTVSTNVAVRNAHTEAGRDADVLKTKAASMGEAELLESATKKRLSTSSDAGGTASGRG